MNSSVPNKRPRLAKRARLQIDAVSGNPVLLHQEAILVLNQSGYEILQLCDGTRTLSDIIRDLGNEYPVAQSILSREVPRYIEVICQKGLIEWI
ncbi:MAG TPA: pyrroloquinoline quinone biosynthesis peptide chaperone PqqD [Chthoniobacterales bacterium]|nr:pyrroloquinoline quinone biosynthesis peptide chaperone PqqD [Chthoniobacterales bacterium]